MIRLPPPYSAALPEKFLPKILGRPSLNFGWWTYGNEISNWFIAKDDFSITTRDLDQQLDVCQFDLYDDGNENIWAGKEASESEYYMGPVSADGKVFYLQRVLGRRLDRR